MSRIGFHRLLLILFGLSLLEAAARLEWLNPKFISPPSSVLGSLVGILQDPEILQAAQVTGYELFTAFLVACLLGISMGLALGSSEFMYRVTNPIVMLLFGIPKISILPLIVLFFGIGVESKIAYGAASAFFPVLMNVTIGVRTVDPSLTIAARSMGANAWQIFSRVTFPASLVSIVTGLRLGLTQGALGVLLCEMYGGGEGIGHYVILWSSSFKPAPLFALFILVAGLVMLGNSVLRQFELRAGRWRVVREEPQAGFSAAGL